MVDEGREIKRMTALCRVYKFCKVLFFKVNSVGDLKFGFFLGKFEIDTFGCEYVYLYVWHVCMGSTNPVTVQFSEFSYGTQ